MSLGGWQPYVKSNGRAVTSINPGIDIKEGAAGAGEGEMPESPRPETRPIELAAAQEDRRAIFDIAVGWDSYIWQSAQP